jgi:D-alanine-D-alanine ligase
VTRIGVHALARHPAPAGGWHGVTPGVLTAALERRLADLALAAFAALDCRDFARVDFKLDAHGEPRFLEINPLPTFAPDGSFAVLAEVSDQPLDALLAEVLGEALRRLGLA